MLQKVSISATEQDRTRKNSFLTEALQNPALSEQVHRFYNGGHTSLSHHGDSSILLWVHTSTSPKI
jgi:hypothetical protein